jgi:hypothetical protein
MQLVQVLSIAGATTMSSNASFGMLKSSQGNSKTSGTLTAASKNTSKTPKEITATTV